MNEAKCAHCPIATEDRQCPGQINERVCLHADPASPTHRPSILAKILSFGTAVVTHVAAGMPRASAEEQARRLAICGECEHHQGGRCQACGCQDRGLAVKTGWAEQSCPLVPPKWGPVVPSGPAEA